ncbi:MAG: hypothetical protein ACUVQP_00090 [Bacteroidales bacterium]
MDDVIRLRGCLEIALKNADGEVIQQIKKENTVVTAGRSWVLKQIASSVMNTAQSIGYIAVGTSTTAPATSDTALGGESVRKAISNFSTGGLTSSTPFWTAEVLFATDEANTTLAEVGLFNSSSGGTMLARATFSTINKATSNTLGVSYSIYN